MKDCGDNEIRVGDRTEFLTKDGGNVDGIVVEIGPKKVKVAWVECGFNTSRWFFPESLLKV